MNSKQCEATYTRVVDGEVQHVRCTYISEHKARHSWMTLQAQDELSQNVVQIDRPLMTTVLSSIHDGEYDAYLEAILAVAHERKRALRGVRTFDRLRGESSG